MNQINQGREARLGRSLKRLNHRLVKRPGGFAIADDNGEIVESGTLFSKTMSLDDVQAWIEAYVKPKRKPSHEERSA